jgi:plasmid stabilization system protein ParE
MRLVLHPKVYSDIDEIMGYYERIATKELADEFYSELRHYMQRAAERPESFPDSRA